MLQSNFIMMCGLPGSGKSQCAKEMVTGNTVIVSTDSIRGEINGDESDQSNGDEVFKIAHTRIREALENNQHVIFDACNISSKRRIAMLNSLKKYNINKICFFCWKPYEKCLIDNQNRDRVVPEYAIRRMYENFYVPCYFEGWDNILIKASYSDELKPYQDLFYEDGTGLCFINHENKHHSLSIGNHMIYSYFLATQKYPKDEVLRIAALLHDIGKPFVKSHIDKRGNITEDAHYYNHHCVSAYNAVPYVRNKFLYDKKCDECLGLINYHMFPYFWEKDNNEHMRNKYHKLWGDNLYKKIIMLHEIDRNAH